MPGRLLGACFAVAMLAAAGWAQPAPPPLPDWSAMEFLLGKWTAGGSGAPGQGAGAVSFELALGKRVLLRRSSADYPATAQRPAYSHTDLMVFYRAEPSGTLLADYWDNEGHVIHYEVRTSVPATVVMTSPARSGEPRYRLSYRGKSDGTVTGMFEIAPPDKPEAFAKYLEWTQQRAK